GSGRRSAASLAELHYSLSAQQISHPADRVIAANEREQMRSVLRPPDVNDEREIPELARGSILTAKPGGGQGHEDVAFRPLDDGVLRRVRPPCSRSRLSTTRRPHLRLTGEAVPPPGC